MKHIVQTSENKQIVFVIKDDTPDYEVVEKIFLSCIDFWKYRIDFEAVSPAKVLKTAELTKYTLTKIKPDHPVYSQINSIEYTMYLYQKALDDEIDMPEKSMPEKYIIDKQTDQRLDLLIDNLRSEYS